MKQPLKAIDTLLQNVEKRFGKGAMMRLSLSAIFAANLA